MRNRVITIIFCVILAAGIISSIAVPDKHYSENEKRTLKQFPEITAEKVFAGKIPDEVEDYLTDQFPARDAWVTVKTLSELASGKKESAGVYFADDGYLIDSFKQVNEKLVNMNLEAIKRFADSVQNDSSVKTNVMLVPTAAQILTDKMPAFAPGVDQNGIIELAEKIGLNTVDITEAFTKHKDEYIYYRTDHHWTSLGAYYAYAQWKQIKGETPEPINSFKTETLCDDFLGTTYAKVNYPFAKPDTITAYYNTEKHDVSYNDGKQTADSIYERKFLKGKDQYAVFLNSNQATTVVKGDGKGKLLILKDSYANTFAQFVIDEYEETHLIDLRFFKSSVSDYIKENGITEVLLLYNIPNFSSDVRVRTLS